jgi:hypothetical protein
VGAGPADTSGTLFPTVRLLTFTNVGGQNFLNSFNVEIPPEDFGLGEQSLLDGLTQAVVFVVPELNFEAFIIGYLYDVEIDLTEVSMQPGGTVAGSLSAKLSFFEPFVPEAPETDTAATVVVPISGPVGYERLGSVSSVRAGATLRASPDSDALAIPEAAPKAFQRGSTIEHLLQDVRPVSDRVEGGESESADTTACGVGFELGVLLPLASALRRRRPSTLSRSARRALATADCSGLTFRS